MYRVNIECTKGTTGKWNYKEWKLILENIISDSKCNIAFTSDLTEEEYNKFLEEENISNAMALIGQFDETTITAAGRYEDSKLPINIVENHLIQYDSTTNTYLAQENIFVIMLAETIFPDNVYIGMYNGSIPSMSTLDSSRIVVKQIAKGENILFAYKLVATNTGLSTSSNNIKVSGKIYAGTY